MTSVKVKFRPSTVEGTPGSIYYQVIHNRIARQKKTGYRIYQNEWNNGLSSIDVSHSDPSRKVYLTEMINHIQDDLCKMHKIFKTLEQQQKNYSSDDVIAIFTNHRPENYLFGFMEKIIAHLKAMGRIRTSETYMATLNSFKRFRKNKNVTWNDIEPNMIMAYEAYLKETGISPNSSSFYMRNLRAIYNRAVEKGLVEQQYPFKHVYTGVSKTIKRAISIKTIKLIKELDLTLQPSLDFARDMFLFSFYTRGMSFVDMAFLKKKNLKNGILSYRRRKTGQQLMIKWENCMQKLVEKYETKQSAYLLPIIRPMKRDERKQYIYVAHNINRGLKEIGVRLGLIMPLTMYVARHSWASIAKSKNVPISIISEGMGHDSENTTRIYLTTLDTQAVDKANRLIINLL